MTGPSDRLSDLAGRTPVRADSRNTHQRLIDAVRRWVSDHEAAPERLADVAAAAGVSTATAYRHFASVDDAIRAVVLELPARAVDLFEADGGDGGDPVVAFHRWNRAWVIACIEQGPLAVRLRSPVGFLHRRTAGDPAVRYVCRTVEPLLAALEPPSDRAGPAGDRMLMLFTWNIVSDPREVLDLENLGWSADRIAEFVTETVLATPS